VKAAGKERGKCAVAGRIGTIQLRVRVGRKDVLFEAPSIDGAVYDGEAKRQIEPKLQKIADVLVRRRSGIASTERLLEKLVDTYGDLALLDTAAEVIADHIERLRYPLGAIETARLMTRTMTEEEYGPIVIGMRIMQLLESAIARNGVC